MTSRLSDLLRRADADPTCAVFAQLAEEYRRLGMLREAVDWCRKGLAQHPGYLSAYVILGRALTELGELDEAAEQFAHVLRVAPDNLAAVRGLAELDQRRGGTPVDFDAVLTALGAPGLDPPPGVARLLSDPPSQAAAAAAPVVETAPPDEAFQALERSLREFEVNVRAAMPAQAAAAEVEPMPSPPVDTLGDDRDVLAELESWLSALRAEADGESAV